MTVCQALQREIDDKQAEFSNLQTMASQVQGADARQIGYSTQLASKYETLKAGIKVGGHQNHVK